MQNKILHVTIMLKCTLKAFQHNGYMQNQRQQKYATLILAHSQNYATFHLRSHII